MKRFIERYKLVIDEWDEELRLRKRKAWQNVIFYYIGIMTLTIISRLKNDPYLFAVGWMIFTVIFVFLQFQKDYKVYREILIRYGDDIDRKYYVYFMDIINAKEQYNDFCIRKFKNELYTIIPNDELTSNELNILMLVSKKYARRSRVNIDISLFVSLAGLAATFYQVNYLWIFLFVLTMLLSLAFQYFKKAHLEEISVAIEELLLEKSFKKERFNFTNE